MNDGELGAAVCVIALFGLWAFIGFVVWVKEAVRCFTGSGPGKS